MATKEKPASVVLKPRKGTPRHRWLKEELSLISGLANEGQSASVITDKINKQFKLELTSNQVGKKLGNLRKRTSLP